MAHDFRIETLVLRNAQLEVEIDPGRGADILRITELTRHKDLLLSTPLRGRADALRAGRETLETTDDEAQWLEHYRGGWQTLFPNAGPASVHEGTLWQFHGEASTAAWTVVANDGASVGLKLCLESAPLQLVRTLQLAGNRIEITDKITNVGTTATTFDYGHHPAFGADLLAQDCFIGLPASTFTNDWDIGIEGVRAGSEHAWPWVAVDGVADLVDLRHVDVSRSSTRFGWISGLETGEVRLVSPSLRIALALAWDVSLLPYLWLWQEVNLDQSWPWLGATKTIALEPCSTSTSGPLRVPGLTAEPGETVQLRTSLSIEHLDQDLRDSYSASRGI